MKDALTMVEAMKVGEEPIKDVVDMSQSIQKARVLKSPKTVPKKERKSKPKKKTIKDIGKRIQKPYQVYLYDDVRKKLEDKGKQLGGLSVASVLKMAILPVGSIWYWMMGDLREEGSSIIAVLSSVPSGRINFLKRPPLDKTIIFPKGS